MHMHFSFNEKDALGNWKNGLTEVDDGRMGSGNSQSYGISTKGQQFMAGILKHLK